MQVLKKMDILRLKRNNKRVERRTAGEENVSDDEGDELSGYIMVVPSGENTQPKGNTDTSPTRTEPALISKLLFGDDETAKNSFQAHDNSIPIAIFSLAKNGISPPLTLFLPASLERIRSSNVKTVKHGTGESTKVTVIDVSDFPGEDSLDQATWFTCYNTFLGFMDVAAGPQTSQSFAQYYNRILSDPDLSLWFLAYRAFDQKIRAQFFTNPYIIDIQSAEYRSALQSARAPFLFPLVRRISPLVLERSKPYDRDRAPRKRSVLCFRCGRVGHGAAVCEESEPNRHGRQFNIYANREGIFRIRDRRAVCMLFNLGRCTDSHTRNHRIHICSLCGEPHHGASDCTRN
ncbi:hypothetical protein B0H13DRAFT_2401709 [Mycena leptocephala]|nr:hypothetical protein B0H13DRAFT_2401709 [Mycena leptocephala]